MTEKEFFRLYQTSFTNIIRSYFPKLDDVKIKYPNHLQSQMDYYRVQLCNIGNNLATELVIANDINLQEMYSIEHTTDWLLNRLTVTSWGYQQVPMEIYTSYCQKLNQDLK
jgi:hypothetical protein